MSADEPVPNPALGSPAQTSQSYETSQSSVELLESLRRISRSVGSNLGLDTVLQAVVDAVCDHTQWQVCWINEVHVAQNAAEVVARRDKLEYTTESRQRRWDLHRSPSLEALRQNEPIAMPDVTASFEYPDYRDDALRRGTVAGVVIPFNTADPTDLPRTLCVQSTLPLLGDDRQLPFLRTVAGMASLAVLNARQADAARREMLQATEALSLFTFATEGLAKGMSTEWLASQLEQRTDSSLLIFDCAGTMSFIGRSPISYELSDSEWQREVREASTELTSRVLTHTSGSVITSNLPLDGVLPLPPTLRATVSRLPGNPSLGAVVSVTRADGGQHVHGSLVQALASTVLRDQTRFDVERDLRADALTSLFVPGPVDDPSVTRRAETFGINISKPQTIVLIRNGEPRNDGNSPKLRLAISAVLQRWSAATAHSFGSDIVVFLPGEHADDPAVGGRIEELYAVLASSFGESEIFMVWAGPCLARSDYPTAWNECLTTMDLAQKLGRHDPVNLREFGSYRFLLSAIGEQDIGTYIEQTIGAVVEHDRAHGSELLETVEAFLHCGGRLQETARKLHIHVSTLRYRMDRIHLLSGTDLSEDNARFEVSLAVRLRRLRLLHSAGR